MTDEKDWDEQKKLTEYVIKKISDRITGNGEDVCIKNYPRDVYFVGNLRPKDQDLLDEIKTKPQYLNELSSKLSPVSFGAEFLLEFQQDKPTLEITLKWSCYYRVFPTYSEQKNYQLNSGMTEEENENIIDADGEAEEPNGDTNDLKINNATGSVTRNVQRFKSNNWDTFMKKFKKIPCSAVGILQVMKDDKGDYTADSFDLKKAIEQQTTNAKKILLNDKERYIADSDENLPVSIKNSVLDTEESYNSFIKNLKTDVIPTWDWDIKFNIKKWKYEDSGTKHELTIKFVNSSEIIKSSINKEGFFFDVGASFKLINCSLFPYRLTLAPKNFRYNSSLWGHGFNCGLEIQSYDSNHPSVLTTTNIPSYKQKRLTSRNSPKMLFSDLMIEPITHLKELLDSLKEYYKTWEEEHQNNKNKNEWTSNFECEFEGDFKKFKSEVEDFENGLNLLTNNSDLLTAFKLTNEVFKRAGEKSNPKKTSWRLFQIVFFVSQIPDIASLDPNIKVSNSHRDTVDIIYFPTGGGKTETYLAVTVFQVFFDRFRGKKGGVSVWTRFPLRLLSIQQMQRFADIIGIAELLRLKQKDSRLNGENVDSFAVGYFVGESSTPNEIVEPAKDDGPMIQLNWSIANDAKNRQKWRRIYKCPSCGTYTVTLEFDNDKIRLLHKCSNPYCAFPNGVIPVFIIDNEIYRYLPCVIVGTIDKLAGLGTQRKMSLLFGQADKKCEKHGYYKIICSQKHCTCKKFTRINPDSVSAPSLFVQDELHLLKEELGTFDSHYETFAQYLVKYSNKDVTLKIIASTATIEAYKRQIEHLYMRHTSRVFPGFGPALEQSFYTETFNYPQRTFIGIIPHNKTIFNSILELTRIYHETIQNLENMSPKDTNPYGGAISPGTLSWKNLMNNYDVTLSYFGANKELSSISTDINSAVNGILKNNGYNPLTIAELTGRTSTDEVSRTLNQLESDIYTEDSKLDTILATSMVSHGVDITRLNAMIFYGMPRGTGEYIQSSSRVGRMYSGIVFNCLHPARERDQSNYIYFEKHHEFLGQLVEPVAINRWSRLSVEKTLPGLFMSVLLQILANQDTSGNPNKLYKKDYVMGKITSGAIKTDDFVKILDETYLGDSDKFYFKNHLDQYNKFKNELDENIRSLADNISTPNPTATFVSETFNPRPMISLRDVDEQIEIVLDDVGTYWGNNMHKR